MLSFEPTQPFAERDTKRTSDFVRYVGDLVRETETGPSRLSTLSPSLMQDLLRFDQDPPQRQLLEVLAACVRHTQPLAIDVAWERQALTLSVFPTARLVHCPMPMDEFLAGDLTALEVRRVQPAHRARWRHHPSV